MHKLVLLRHGESTWNLENRFTGWTDVDSRPKGRRGGPRRRRKLLQEGGYAFDVAYTSVLKRAIRTLWIALDEMDLMWIPVHERLAAQRAALRRPAGPEQGRDGRRSSARSRCKIWRRSYDDAAARRSTPDDERYPGQRPALRRPDARRSCPLTECLKDTVARFLPYWHDAIVPDVKAGKRVLIAAHGNSLRALVKYLDNISDEEIVELNIPTGIPLVYELDDDLKPITHYYLGDPEAARKAAEAVANQSKAK